MRPVNYERCRQELGNAIYRKIGDVALVLHLLTSEKTGSSLTIQVSRGMVLPWKLTEDQLITEAMMNTCRKMPPRLFLGDDRRKFFPYEEGILLPEEEGRQTWISPWNHREGQRGYLLTTTARIHGAVAFFYPGVKAILHPVDCTGVQEIRSSVQHINAVYGEGEMLSDRIFCYHKNRRLLQLL